MVGFKVELFLQDWPANTGGSCRFWWSLGSGFLLHGVKMLTSCLETLSMARPKTLVVSVSNNPIFHDDPWWSMITIDWSMVAPDQETLPKRSARRHGADLLGRCPRVPKDTWRNGLLPPRNAGQMSHTTHSTAKLMCRMVMRLRIVMVVMVVMRTKTIENNKEKGVSWLWWTTSMGFSHLQRLRTGRLEGRSDGAKVVHVHRPMLSDERHRDPFIALIGDHRVQRCQRWSILPPIRQLGRWDWILLQVAVVTFIVVARPNIQVHRLKWSQMWEVKECKRATQSRDSGDILAMSVHELSWAFMSTISGRPAESCLNMSGRSIVTSWPESEGLHAIDFWVRRRHYQSGRWVGWCFNSITASFPRQTLKHQEPRHWGCNSQPSSVNILAFWNLGPKSNSLRFPMASRTVPLWQLQGKWQCPRK